MIAVCTTNITEPYNGTNLSFTFQNGNSLVLFWFFPWKLLFQACPPILDEVFPKRIKKKTSKLKTFNCVQRTIYTSEKTVVWDVTLLINHLNEKAAILSSEQKKFIKGLSWKHEQSCTNHGHLDITHFLNLRNYYVLMENDAHWDNDIGKFFCFLHDQIVQGQSSTERLFTHS